MIDRFQFDILSHTAENGSVFGFPEKLSGGLIKAFEDSGYISDGRITAKGLAVLEPYCVRRAVLLGAFRGAANELCSVGIRDICAVCGDERGVEEFRKEFPDAKTMVCIGGRMAALQAAGDMLRGAYVIEADKELPAGALRRYQYGTNFAAVCTANAYGPYFSADDGLYITGYGSGAEDGFAPVGMGYVSADDAALLLEGAEMMLKQCRDDASLYEALAAAYPDRRDIYIRVFDGF